MADAAADCPAFDEAVVFLSHFRNLQDPYGNRGKTLGAALIFLDPTRGGSIQASCVSAD